MKDYSKYFSYMRFFFLKEFYSLFLIIYDYLLAYMVMFNDFSCITKAR